MKYNIINSIIHRSLRGTGNYWDIFVLDKKRFAYLFSHDIHIKRYKIKKGEFHLIRSFEPDNLYKCSLFI